MTEQPYAELGAALRRCRRLSGLSLRILARRLGLRAHSALTDYEHGRRLVPEDLLARYERAFPEQAQSLRRLWGEALAARFEVDERDATAGRGTPGPRPAQLPAGLTDFVGRVPEIAMLSAAAAAPVPGPRILVLSGAPGMGKTSLAVHLAHRLAGGFPDGQLFTDLHGGDSRSATTAGALAGMVRALGAADAAVPADEAELSAYYRSLLAGRAVLLLLDDAVDERQVRPLLPGSAGTLVIVTSRAPLGGLDGAVHCALPPLSGSDTVALLDRIVGPERVTAEPTAAAEIARHCAGLPLAARIAGGRLAAWPRWRLAEYAEVLSDERRRLDHLTAGDRAVRAAFDTTYAMLPDAARRLFRRFPLLAGPDCSDEGAAALTGTDKAEAAALLRSLAAAGLAQHAPDHGRYRLHDLIALYARERLHAEEGPAERDRAEHAALDWLLGTAAEAAAHLDPEGPVGRGTFAGRAEAVRWLDAERPAILQAVRRASDLDRPDLVYPLVPLLPWYYDLRCRWRDQHAMARAALTLARRHGDAPIEVLALNGLALAWHQLHRPAAMLRCATEAAAIARRISEVGEEAWALDRAGMALTGLGRYAKATITLRRAAALAHEYGDWWEEAAALNHLGHALNRSGRPGEALDAYGQALRIFQALERPANEAMARVGMGRALFRLGRTAEAIPHHQAAMRLFAGVDDGWGSAYAHHELGLAMRAAGQPDAANDLLGQAAELFAVAGDRRRQAASLRARAAVSGAGSP